MTAADIAVSGLLNPQRAARLVEFHARDPKAPGFDEVVAALIKKTWNALPASGRAGAVARAVQWLVVTRLIGLAGDEKADPRVRAAAAHALEALAREVENQSAPSALQPDDWAVAEEIHRFLKRPDPNHRRAEPPPSPPGDPIGGGR